MKTRVIKENNTVDVGAHFLGKKAPESKELEEAVLGAIILENQCLEDYAIQLNEGLFYHKSSRLIYSAIHQLYTKKESVDIITVSNRLKEIGEIENAGGYQFVMNLTTNASSSNIEFYLYKLKEFYLKRRTIEICAKGLEDAYDLESDVFDDIGIIESQMNGLNSEVISGTAEFDIAKSIDRTVDHLVKPREKEYLGLPTGNSELSNDIGGFQAPDIIILAARPSQGKTDKMLNHACHLTEKGIPVAIFSLETVVEHKINIRLLSRYARLDNYIVKAGAAKWTPQQMQAISDAKERIAKLPLYIYDEGIMTPSQIRAICRKLKREKNLGMVFGDYIQLVTPDEHIRGNREQEVAQISRSFKLMAKELDLPMMWLSQLNRGLENRGNKRPQLSDIRESGAIEQDADVVLSLYSPFLSGEDYVSWGAGRCAESDYPDVIETCILKNKNGPADKSVMEFYHRPTSTFSASVTTIEEYTKQTDLPF